MPHYMPITECIASGNHLKECDNDGYCESCGEQGTGEMDTDSENG